MSDELLITYSVHDSGNNNDYRNGFIKKIEGDPAGDVYNPVITMPDETYLPVGPLDGIPRLFSYALGRRPMVLMAVVYESQGQPNHCIFTLAAPNAGGCKAWDILAQDIVLQGNTGPVTNPYGMAQSGGMLFLIDYDSQDLILLGLNELDGQPPGDYYPANPPFNVGAAANLPANARGQTIIALPGHNGEALLYALYTVPNQGVYPSSFENSILVRLELIDGEYLTYVDKVDTLAKNAQDLIFVDSGGVSTLFIPAIGGPQNLGGNTNGTNAALDKVDLFFMSHTRLLTGNEDYGYPSAWDIRAFAAPPNCGSDDPVYLMTGTMGPGPVWNWGLYQTTIPILLSLTGETIADALSAGHLTQIEDYTADNTGTFWDIFCETGTDPAGSRIWLLKGSPLEIHSAADYNGAPHLILNVGFDRVQLGGRQMGNLAFIHETLRQADLGLSLKRGLRGIPPYRPI